MNSHSDSLPEPSVDVKISSTELPLDRCVHTCFVIVAASLGTSFLLTAHLRISSWASNTAITCVFIALLVMPTIRKLVRGDLGIEVDVARTMATTTGLGAIVVVALRVVDGHLLPPSQSVDVAHHLALTEWIIRHGGLPTHVVPNLMEMTSYPFGVHVLAATLTKVTTLVPLQAMTVVSVALLSLTASALVVAGARLAAMVSRSEPTPVEWGISLVSVVGLLTASAYSFDMFTVDFFFAQILGLYLVVVSLMFIVDRTPSGTALPWAAVIAGAALVYAYPLFIPVYACLMLPTLADAAERFGLRAMLHYAVGTLALLGAAVLLFLPGRLTTGLQILDNNGGIGHPSVALLGGFFTLALGAVGVVCATTAIRWRNWLAAVVPIGIAMALLECGAIQWLQRSVAGSQYQAIKLVYVALFLGFAAAPTTLIVVWSACLRRFSTLRRADRSPIATVVLCIALLCFAAFDYDFHRLPSGVEPSDYSLVVWAESHVDPAEIDEVSPGVGGYILWVGVLYRPRTAIATYYLTGQCNLLNDWIVGRTTYFLVSSPAQLTAIEDAGLRYRVVHRIGPSMLIRREGRPTRPPVVPPSCVLG